MRIGIGVGEIANQPATVDALIEQVRAAERDGFASAWFAHIFGMDAMTACALAGRETKSIELGTAVVPTYPRHPVVMAQQALSTNAACGGRFRFGIGLSHQIVIESMLGLSWAKPYSHMKEYVAVLRGLFDEGNSNHQGEEYRVQAQLNVTGGEAPPLLIAALAPKMLALAGSQTDGTITWMTGAKTVREHTAPRLRDAAAKAGRKEPRIVCGLPVAICDDPKAAREKAAQVFQVYGYLPSYRAMLDREGAEGPADVAVVGDESSVGEQLDRIAEAGATDFMAAIFPVGDDGRDSVARTREFLIRRARA
jgi:5,10-methylenetetrahydromethanopterin reductase